MGYEYDAIMSYLSTVLL